MCKTITIIILTYQAQFKQPEDTIIQNIHENFNVGFIQIFLSNKETDSSGKEIDGILGRWEDFWKYKR